MTTEITVQGPDGASYIESGVNCKGTHDARAIWRKEDAVEWCAKGVEGFCSRQKIRVAQKVCGRQYAVLLESQAKAKPETQPEPVVADEVVDIEQPEVPAAPLVAELSLEQPIVTQSEAASEVATEQSAAGREAAAQLDEERRQLEIERERLKIEQQRLELRRQSVELQKQEREMQRQVDESRSLPAVSAPPANNSSGGPSKSVLGM